MEEDCWRQRRRWRINNMRRRGVGVTVKEFIPYWRRRKPSSILLLVAVMYVKIATRTEF